MGITSFRDPVSQVLVGHGFVTTNRPGDLAQPEADDFSLEPGLWRWNGSAWAAYTPPPQPDPSGFEIALHDAFPDQSYLTFLAAFPASWVVVDSIRRGVWSQVQGLFQLALGTGAVTQQQYNAVKAAATAHHIPVTL